jgi:hypothetical protein
MNRSLDESALPALVLFASHVKRTVAATLGGVMRRAIDILERGAKLRVLFVQTAHVLATELGLLASVKQDRGRAENGQLRRISQQGSSRKRVFPHRVTLAGG